VGGKGERRSAGRTRGRGFIFWREMRTGSGALDILAPLFPIEIQKWPYEFAELHRVVEHQFMSVALCFF